MGYLSYIYLLSKYSATGWVASTNLVVWGGLALFAPNDATCGVVQSLT